MGPKFFDGLTTPSFEVKKIVFKNHQVAPGCLLSFMLLLKMMGVPGRSDDARIKRSSGRDLKFKA